MSFMDHVDDHIKKQEKNNVVVIFILSCLAVPTSCFETGHFIEEYFQLNRYQDARSFKLRVAKAILNDLQVCVFLSQAQIHVSKTSNYSLFWRLLYRWLFFLVSCDMFS